ncbi:demethylmenaquinone methyltransferase/2-methoxy-6-polyprenyl-1,4-benzoquinol methylase [Leucobacter luti]|uniref:Demethylmenaquinone methyltransferase n=1 Tax=Leucobacter luti TaxID=340320 RepID=A0A4Q7TT55_9MICO|nr:demethylmenaquinone methyltransferase/2-methoxy-6-polyprenyl-1,4-benzoquinol methylase [Leucobacter luti]
MSSAWTGYHGGVIRPDTATKHAADVSSMFDEVSPRYDLINDVLTVGNDRLWRIATTKAVAPRKGMRILDLAAGTGTSSAALAAHGAHVVAADFSEGMLAEGRKRHADNELIEFVHADGTALPFDDDSFDAATISYGLRNISDPRAALAELFRVVKPGGRLVIAEFSTPPSSVVRGPYAFYGRHVLPRVAGALNREAADAYRYLNESIESWPNQEALAGWLREAGFERVAYRNLTFGIVALHRGFVPREAPVAAAKAATAAKGSKATTGAKAATGAKGSKATTGAKAATGAPAKAEAAQKSAPAAKAAWGKKPATAKTSSGAKSAPATTKPASAAKKPAAKPAASGATKPAAKKSASAAKQTTAKPAAAAKSPAKAATTAKPAAKPAAAKPRPSAASNPSTTPSGSSDATGGTE